MIVIGIDPGLSGALAAMDTRGLLGVEDLPVMAKAAGGGKVKQQLNPAALATILEDWARAQEWARDSVLVLLERVQAMPKQGVSSMFSLGHTCGAIEGVLAAKRLPVQFVTPQAWKKHFGLSADKEVARSRAISLFPQAPLSRVKDHGRAEAILLARYGMEALA